MTETEPSVATPHKPGIFAGASTGLLKSVDLGKRQAANYYGPDELDKSHEIRRMLLTNQSRALLVAMRNGGVKRFDCETRHFAAPVKMWRDDDDADWVGLYEQREMIIGCDKSGKVASWSRDAFDEAEQKNQVNFEKGESNFYTDSEELEQAATFDVTTGPSETPVRCSAQRANLLAVAGDETQLQVFDMAVGAKGCVFKSKAPPPDKLQLHIPLHFPAVAMPRESETIIAAAYGSKINQSHEIRLYDPRASQRRPVKRVQWERHPITAICSLDGDGHKVACGNARGKMMWLDMRHEKRIHPLKGPAGSVRAIGQHPDHATHVAAVGLDRHLYVFDVKTNQRKQKIYLKSQLNTVLIEPGAALEREKEEKENKKENSDSEDEEEMNDDETEKIWRDLED